MCETMRGEQSWLEKKMMMKKKEMEKRLKKKGEKRKEEQEGRFKGRNRSLNLILS